MLKMHFKDKCRKPELICSLSSTVRLVYLHLNHIGFIIEEILKEYQLGNNDKNVGAEIRNPKFISGYQMVIHKYLQHFENVK